jgi:hypothetical protein
VSVAFFALGAAGLGTNEKCVSWANHGINPSPVHAV